MSGAGGSGTRQLGQATILAAPGRLPAAHQAAVFLPIDSVINSSQDLLAEHALSVEAPLRFP
jgi:hypothetical protein